MTLGVEVCTLARGALLKLRGASYFESRDLEVTPPTEVRIYACSYPSRIIHAVAESSFSFRSIASSV